MSWLSQIIGGNNQPAQSAANQQTQLIESQQATHDAAVNKGKQSIDSAFASFDQPYFDAYGQSYRDAYNPELTDQYNIAKDKITAALAGNDQLGGSVGNNTLAQLEKTYGTAQGDIGNKSIDAENQLKGTVSNTETNLYNMNANAADPFTTAAQAQAAAGSIVSPQSYPTIGNVFGDALSGVSSAAKTNSTSLTPYAPSQWNAPTTGTGSGVWK